MSKHRAVYRAVLSSYAQKDIRNVLAWSIRTFGASAASRYRDLLNQALHDLELNPTRPGSRSHPGLVPDARLYHLSLSSKRANSDVKKPRHQIAYRIKDDRVEIARILYDSRDLLRHLPREYRA